MPNPFVAVSFALTLAAALPAQQLWLASNDNTSYGSYAVGWPSSVIAFHFTAPANATVTAAEVFTGNTTPSPHTLEIRQNDPATGLPGALVGQPGSWTLVHTRCWQGAQFAQPAALVANQDYWLVWSVTGMFPQHSVSADNLPGNVLVDTRYSDGTTWHAQAMTAGKFRLFTGATTGTQFAFGLAKPGVYGDPTLGISGWPSVGSVFDVWLDNAARRQVAILALGVPVNPGLVLPLGTSYTSAAGLVFVQTNTQTTPTSGGFDYTVVVPPLPVLQGFALACQWAITDAAAAGGLSHTAAVTVVLQ